MDPKEIGRLLAEPFPPDCVGWKPIMVKNNKGLAFAYLDARSVCNRLDDVVGIGDWQDRYAIDGSGSVVCRLSVRIDDKWVTKVDVGSLSEQQDGGDRLKAAFSDALKRAAVKWGVGRYLYDLEPQWCDYDPVRKQFTQKPRLPAWALPKGKAAPQKAQEKPQAKTAPAEDEDPPATAQQVYKIEELVETAGADGKEVGDWLRVTGSKEWADMTGPQIEWCISECNRRIAEKRRK